MRAGQLGWGAFQIGIVVLAGNSTASIEPPISPAAAGLFGVLCAALVPGLASA
jgi:hypothetical protein